MKARKIGQVAQRRLHSARRRVAEWRPTGRQFSIGAAVIAAVGISLLLRDTSALEMLAYSASGAGDPDHEGDKLQHPARGEYEDVVVYPEREG